MHNCLTIYNNDSIQLINYSNYLYFNVIYLLFYQEWLRFFLIAWTGGSYVYTNVNAYRTKHTLLQSQF